MLTGCIAGVVLAVVVLALLGLAIIGIGMAHAADDHEDDNLYELRLPAPVPAKRDEREVSA